jgi:hypothetical protein
VKLPSIAFVGVLLAACSVTASPDLSGPVPLAHGAAASFTPLVEASSGAPSCVHPADAPLDPGSRAIAMLYRQPTTRQVTVTLDGTGTPVRYLDVRGDLSESDDRSADRTTIGLYLEQGYAVLSNREGAGPPDMLEVPLDEVLTSPRLGDPSREMQHVMATCAGAV